MEENKDCKQDVVLSNLGILMMLLCRNIFLAMATKQKRERKGECKAQINCYQEFCYSYFTDNKRQCNIR